MQSNLSPLLLILSLLAFASATSATTPPSQTYPNGTINPFYPCGTTAASIGTCPYRCFSSTGSLRPPCYTQSSATAAISSLNDICVQCIAPCQPEDYPGGCQPLLDYFNGKRPSRCGFVNHRLRDCAWDCGEAQVPFDLCDTTNTTGIYRSCQRCLPQCSSPRVVFQPGYLPSNFSLSAGSCGTQYGAQEDVACPFRCTDVGNPNTYCSLANKTGDLSGFTSCVGCS